MPGRMDIGSRLERFVDRYLIERTEGTQLKLGRLAPVGVALRFDEPWARLSAGYITVRMLLCFL